MESSEPPLPEPGFPVFFIGKNSRGNWIAQDRRGLCGGLFVDRSHALRFALFENGHHPDAIVMVPEAFELNMGTSIPADWNLESSVAPQRCAA